MLVNLCGAVIWWQGARLLTGGPAAGSMVLMASATVVAVLTKRVAAPLVMMLAVVPVVAVWFGRPDTWRAVRPAAAMIGGGLCVAGLVAIVWPGEETARLTEYWAYLMTWSWSDQAREWAFFQRFTSGLFDSAWLMAGRLRYPAPPAWLTAVRLLTVVAAAGCVIGARRSGLAPWRPGIVLAGALVAIQIAGVYVGVYMNGFGPQGRYLLPVVGPFMALFWIGLHSWWPRRSWPLVSAVVVTLMFVLDAIGWAEVLIARVSWLVRWVRDDR